MVAGVAPDLLVAGALEAQVAHMRGVRKENDQVLRKAGGEILIQQQLHAAGSVTSAANTRHARILAREIREARRISSSDME